jgi:hypothetical protein
MDQFNIAIVAKRQCKNPRVAVPTMVVIAVKTRPIGDILFNKTAIMDLGFSRLRQAEGETASQSRRPIGGPTLLLD